MSVDSFTDVVSGMVAELAQRRLQVLEAACEEAEGKGWGVLCWRDPVGQEFIGATPLVPPYKRWEFHGTTQQVAAALMNARAIHSAEFPDGEPQPG